MMKSRVYLVEHLSADELYRLYREEKDAIRRTHLQALWLVTSGRPAKFAAAVTGYTQRWLSVLIGRYNEAGVEGLGDRRQFNPGSRPLLDGDKRERLDRALDHPPPDGGLWTGRLVAQWICGLLNRLGFAALRAQLPAPPRLHPSGAAAAACRRRFCRPGAVQGWLPRPHGRAGARPSRPVGADPGV